MAIHNSVQYAVLSGNPFDRVKGTFVEGRVRLAFGAIPGGQHTLAQGDSIKLFDLPAGAMPVAIVLRTGALGSGVMMSLGTTPNGNNLMAATSVAAATNAVVPVAPGALAPLAEKRTVYAYLDGANPADNQPIEVGILYALT
jgi:hypothetical protein